MSSSLGLTQTRTPISPSPTLTFQLIEFTYYHDKFPDQALTHKHTKYDPLLTPYKIMVGKSTPHYYHNMSKGDYTQTLNQQTCQPKNPRINY